jgi:predicted glycosyltransferase
VEEIAQSHRLHFEVIGRHRTPHFFATRAAATIVRGLRLAAYGRKHRPDIAVNHGSRAQVIAAWLLRIPVMTIYDYEFVYSELFSKMATKLLLSGWHTSPGIMEELQLDPRRLIIVVRPPATWAHYQNPLSEVLFAALVERLRGDQNAQVVVLPRTQEQGERLKNHYGMCTAPFRVSDRSVDALSLMAQSDAVLSGGGTMAREAAIMGTPAYSLFAGKPGAVDAALERDGRLTILREISDIENLRFVKASRAYRSNSADARTGEVILQHIIALGS